MYEKQFLKGHSLLLFHFLPCERYIQYLLCRRILASRDHLEMIIPILHRTFLEDHRGKRISVNWGKKQKSCCTTCTDWKAKGKTLRVPTLQHQHNWDKTAFQLRSCSTLGNPECKPNSSAERQKNPCGSLGDTTSGTGKLL